MKVKYFTEDDLLVIRLSDMPYDYAEKIGMFIIHYTRKKEPVVLEILNASKFLKETTQSLPYYLKEKVFSEK